MHKNRLEAFSDGVIAIIITVMVLELREPLGASLADLRGAAPGLLFYVLSFVFVAIYWNNHHHMFQAVQKVDGAVLWANLLLLFWLSLIPFATNWMGEHFGPVPVAAYGVVLLAAGMSYYLLSRLLLRTHGPDSVLAKAIGEDVKGVVSLLIYLVAVVIAAFRPAAACALYVVVALMWFVPDRRIESLLP